MIARSFKSVAWVAAIGAAALICYIFSLQVAEERAELVELDAQIRRTEHTIQTLKTELGTRGRMQQLQHWAAADFGYTAPTAHQFLDDEVTLARFEAPAELPAMDAPVRLADAAPAAPQAPRVVQAAAPVEAAQPVRRAAAAPPQPSQPLLRQASLPANAPATAPAPAPRRTAAPAPPSRTAAPRGNKPAAQPAATRATSIVNSRTLRDINARAAAETAARRAN